MKFWISQTDRRNLETGRNDDTNWMVRELGLTEILFEPPPPRPRPDPALDVPDEDEDDLPPYLTLPDPPALPDRPWTKPEAARLMDRAIKTFSPMSDAADYFSDLQYPLFPDLNDVLGEPLKDAGDHLFVSGGRVGRALLCSPRDAPARLLSRKTLRTT